MNKLRLMSVFVQVVESGSISKAADKLDVSKSVVSTALKQLEQELYTTLLKRTTRKQTLTSAGERFYAKCAQMSAIAESAWLEASSSLEAPKGRLTVTAPHALMKSIVLPSLTAKFKDHPQVSLNLIADDKHVDIIQDDVDLAIRIGSSKNSNLKQRKLGEFVDLLCSTETKNINVLSTPYIAQHWESEPITHELEVNGQSETIHFPISHRASTVFDVVSLIETGLGIGLVPDFILNKHKSLSAISDARPTKVNPIYVLHPYQAHVPLVVTLAIEAIEKMISERLTSS
ncbi:LysR family transcriptional regulator [Vibrio sp. SCSIO 43140]|uniref:LysR family transcriptional regulator n=1 Tax=Vibrio sp. SCSIO 43140 TaxID=2819100 RepID=UPI0020764D9E|nr:LysR family transcriptional regulator [Vibrio sp. SCSIO 43140]USD61836.1 LysR family transcriptional regulator [Vibrio sp. SCSIO 43140]